MCGVSERRRPVEEHTIDLHSFSRLVDVENMHGNLLDAMSDAIENSTFFLMCFTEKYKDSPSCRLGLKIRRRSPLSMMIFYCSH